MSVVENRGILLIVIDECGLELAEKFVAGNTLSRLAAQDTLIVVVAIGPGGGVCLSATPAEHVQFVHLPAQLTFGHVADADIVVDALHEAMHLSGLGAPPVWVIGFLSWPDYPQLTRDLGSLENLHYVGGLDTSNLKPDSTTQEVATPDLEGDDEAAEELTKRGFPMLALTFFLCAIIFLTVVLILI